MLELPEEILYQKLAQQKGSQMQELPEELLCQKFAQQMTT